LGDKKGKVFRPSLFISLGYRVKPNPVLYVKFAAKLFVTAERKKSIPGLLPGEIP
jgi:hypothetical protein